MQVVNRTHLIDAHAFESYTPPRVQNYVIGAESRSASVMFIHAIGREDLDVSTDLNVNVHAIVAVVVVDVCVD